MSISQNFPEEGPTLNLNFAGSKVLDPRITFSRPSTSGDATYMDANGLIVTAAADEPRFDHRYVNGEIESLGLLVEEQRSNLLPYTEDFSSSWSHIGFTSNAVDSTYANPTGSLGTKKLIEETGNIGNQKVLYRYHNVDGAGGNNQIFSHSCFVKPIGNRHAQLNVHNAGTPARGISVNFDLNNIDTPFSTSISSFASSVSYGVIPYPNGWYKLYLIGNTSSQDSDGTTLAFHVRILNASGSSNYTGDGSSGLYVYGAQMEVGAFPTSYIPTTSSQATRSPDNVSMTGTNFSDWYNQSEGTIYCSGNNTGITTTTSRFYYAIENTSSSSGNFIRKWIWNGNTGLLLNSFYTSNTTGQGSVISAEFGNTLTTDNKKTAVGYAKSDFASYYNGTSLNTDTSGNLPVGIDRIRIGTNLSGHISQLTYYPTRLSNTVLQNLTK